MGVPTESQSKILQKLGEKKKDGKMRLKFALSIYYSSYSFRYFIHYKIN